MSVTQQTAEEFAESITGFDEIAIAKTFAVDLYEMQSTKQARALCFVHFRREGAKDPEAYEAAMNLTVKAVTEFFADDDEVMPEEPVTEAGKDV